MLAIFFASSQSDPQLPDQVSDKTAHGVAYATLATAATRAFAGGLPAVVGPGVAASAWLLSVGYGVTDEFHQSFTPGRTPDVADVYADAIGACLGVAACWGWGIIAARLE